MRRSRVRFPPWAPLSERNHQDDYFLFVRKFLYIAVLSLIGFTAPPSATAASSVIPAGGSWNWCNDQIVNGCIQSVTTTSPDGISTTYTTSTSLPSGLTVTIMCSVDMGQDCDSEKFDLTTSGPCTQKANWGSRPKVPDIQMDVDWTGKQNWQVAVTLSTGNFRPAFVIGHGTRATETRTDGDGTYTFILTVLIETHYSASPPLDLMSGPNWITGYQNWLKTAEATSAKEKTHVQIWPKDHLINVNKSSSGCNYYPFEGSWAEANAQGFSWSYSTSPQITSGQISSPNVLKFTASAPHYLPRSVADPLQPMPARVQVFLPTSYFTGLGYSSLNEVDTSIFSITTEDGQQTTPSVTKQERGALINLGLQHYSTPNPTLTFKPKSHTSSPAASTPSATSTPSVTLRASARVQNSRATLTVSLSKAQTYKIYRKVGSRLTLLKTVKGKRGTARLVFPHRRGSSYVVKSARGTTLKTLKPSN